MTLIDFMQVDPITLMELNRQGIYYKKDEEGALLTYHLSDEVKSPDTYTAVLELAGELEEGDLFEIVISGSPGGLLSGARVLTTAQDVTLAETSAVVIDNIASAATMVALNADTLVMTKGSSMMIHSASYGYGGKASDVYAHVEFSHKDIMKTMECFYRPFLTKKEFKKALNGKEFYFTAEECSERFEKVTAKREKESFKKALAQLQEQKAQLEENLESINALIDANS